MIRILVAEDEPPIQRAVVQAIRQAGEAYQVVAAVFNGEKALAYIRENPVDVVFTDIRMPVMGGLELAETLRRERPGVYVVILTGYEDFQYVRKALQSHVYDYLTKPVSPQTLAPLLVRLDAEAAAAREEEQRRLVETALREQPAEPKEAGAEYGVFLLCAGPFPLAADDSLISGRTFWNRKELEKAARPLLQGDENCMAFYGKTPAELVLTLECSRADRLRTFGEALAERLRRKEELPVTAAASAHPVPFAAIGAALNTLRGRLQAEIRLFTPALLWEPGESAAPTGNIDAERLAAGLRDAFSLAENGQPDGLRTALFETVEAFAQAGATQMKLVHFLEKVLTARLSHNAILDERAAQFMRDMDAAVSNAVEPELLAEDLAYVFSGLVETAGEKERRAAEPEVIGRIEAFMREHYAEPITNAVLSEQFGFVPSYVSKLFRTHRGLSPSEYLTRYRIERAKDLLKEHPEMLFKEAAAQVGYADPHYFSKIFKKETGLWPTEYFGAT